jgi:hypothetical protein
MPLPTETVISTSTTSPAREQGGSARPSATPTGTPDMFIFHRSYMIYGNKYYHESEDRVNGAQPVS